MKILMISYDYAGSASGIISRRVAEELVSQGQQVKVICRNIASTPDSAVEVHSVNGPLGGNAFVSRIINRLKRCRSSYFYDALWVRSAIRYGRKLCHEWQPDIIYCRTSPEEACYVGTKLHNKWGAKLVQHFSDPVPAPVEYEPLSRRRTTLLKRMVKVINEADMVSYGNEAMLRYVIEQSGYDFSSKAFISPDAAESAVPHHYNFVERKDIRLTYLGNIYGSRNPQPLFEAIESLNANGAHIHLDIYSPQPSKEPQCYRFVEYKGRTSNVWKAMEQSDILVDLDGDDSTPVFISSKLKDYLLLNRPILSITPNNSPSEQLLKGVDSAVVTRNSKEEIAHSLDQILSSDYKNLTYNDRTALISLFDPKVVVADLLTIFDSITKR